MLWRTIQFMHHVELHDLESPRSTMPGQVNSRFVCTCLDSINTAQQESNSLADCGTGNPASAAFVAAVAL